MRGVLVRAALRLAAAELRGTDAHRQAELLLAHALDCDAADFIARPDRVLSACEADRFEQLLRRVSAGEPLAYVLGEWGFWTLILKVNPHTLIPRPETEQLVEVALQCGDAAAALRVADLGTGCGALALALMSERPSWRIIGVDRSAAALQVAAGNYATLIDSERAGEGEGGVLWCQSDWCQGLADGAFDMIVANPPYVAEDDKHLDDLRHEPRSALVAAENGLADLREIVNNAPRCLSAGGWLLLEHGEEQAESVRGLFAQGWSEVRTWQDLSDHPRVTGARRVR